MEGQDANIVKYYNPTWYLPLLSRQRKHNRMRSNNRDVECRIRTTIAGGMETLRQTSIQAQMRKLQWV